MFNYYLINVVFQVFNVAVNKLYWAIICVHKSPLIYNIYHKFKPHQRQQVMPQFVIKQCESLTQPLPVRPLC